MKKIVWLLITVVTTVGLAGCGERNNADDILLGTWNLVSVDGQHLPYAGITWDQITFTETIYTHSSNKGCVETAQYQPVGTSIHLRNIRTKGTSCGRPPVEYDVPYSMDVDHNQNVDTLTLGRTSIYKRQ